MAITPLFLADESTLYKALRQPGALGDPDNSVRPLVEAAWQKASLEILQTLGNTQIGVIQAIPFNPNGTSSNQVLRRVANLVEVELVAFYLRPQVRVFFASGTNNLGEAWNTGYIASLSEEGFREFQNNAKKEIDDMLLALKGSSPEVSSASVGSSAIGPSCSAPNLFGYLGTSLVVPWAGSAPLPSEGF